MEEAWIREGSKSMMGTEGTGGDCKRVNKGRGRRTREGERKRTE